MTCTFAKLKSKDYNIWKNYTKKEFAEGKAIATSNAYKNNSCWTARITSSSQAIIQMKTY